MKNYYEILGVKTSDSPDEIKRAYRKLASQHHPDKGGDVKKFQEIEEAYRTLSDPEKRQQYDNPNPFGQFGFNQGGPGMQGFDFDTIFDIFGTRFQQHKPQYVRMKLSITLEDVARGGKRTISVGTNQGTHPVEIEIPAGVNDGETFQYQGLAPGGLDLVMSYRVHPHNVWQRQGANLITEMLVNIWDLILGKNITIRDILGNQLEVTVPPRTQPGVVMRVRGRGLPNRHGAPGDILVKLNGEIPKHIPDDLLVLIEQKRG